MDSLSFEDRVVAFNDNVDPLFARGLCVMKGERWRQVRARVTPVFKSGKMMMMMMI